MKKSQIAEVVLIIIGAFLILDSLALHLITFDYVTLGVSWLDAIFDHWMIGVALVAIGGLGLRKRW